jgi:hypothetical protein
MPDRMKPNEMLRNSSYLDKLPDLAVRVQRRLNLEAILEMYFRDGKQVLMPKFKGCDASVQLFQDEFE